MAAKKKPGRKKNPDKKIIGYVYLRPSQKKKILQKHETLTEAILQAVG